MSSERRPKPSSKPTEADLASRLEALRDMSRTDLKEQWYLLYERAVPKGLSTRLLRYAVGYQTQVEVYGGLDAATIRELQRIARNNAKGTPVKAPSKARLSPGTRLVREWHGRTHSIDVVDTGFVYAGKIYRSLSVIARAITGARWSGPRFFGL